MSPDVNRRGTSQPCYEHCGRLTIALATCHRSNAEGAWEGVDTIQLCRYGRQCPTAHL